MGRMCRLTRHKKCVTHFSLNGNPHLEDSAMDRVILKTHIKEIWNKHMDWNHVTRESAHWRLF